VTKSGDGGDTAAETGRWFFWIWVLKKIEYNFDLLPFSKQIDFENALNQLQVEHAVFVRHPKMWNDPKDFSRDQTTPLVAAMGAYGIHDVLVDLCWKHIKRFGFYPNGDFASPEHWALYGRALGLWPLIPFFYLGEISVALAILKSPACLFLLVLSPSTYELINSFVRIYKGHKDFDDVGDDLNHVVCSLQSRLYCPTPITQLSKWIYAKFRPAYRVKLMGYPAPANPGETVNSVLIMKEEGEKVKGSGVQYAFDSYYRESAGSNTEVCELIKPIIARYF
jgi:hypothetical protein